MGQVKDHQDVSRQDRRRRPSRKAIHGFRVALVCAVAAASLFGVSQSSPAVEFDQKLAWAHLEKQVSFGTRVPGSDGHLKARDWIAEELKKSADNVRFQELEHTWSQTGKPVKMWNVLGEQNWKEAKSRVVLLAHWDTRPTADQEWDPGKAAKPIQGANDGASGVAVLLELARALKNEAPKDLGILYLFTDGEDLGPSLDEMFLGAKAFAKNPGDPKPDYGILIDMIGDKDLEVPMEPNSMRYAGKLLIDLYRHAADLGMSKTFPMKEGPWIEDDHIPLNESGIPTIDLIDFDYPHWHKLTDTVDKCAPESLGKVGKLLETWLEKTPPYRVK